MAFTPTIVGERRKLHIRFFNSPKFAIVARRWQVASAESDPMRIRPNIELNAWVSLIFYCWQSNIGDNEYQVYWRRYVELKISSARVENRSSLSVKAEVSLIAIPTLTLALNDTFDTDITGMSDMLFTGMIQYEIQTSPVFKEAGRTRKRYLADLRRGIHHVLLCVTSVTNVD